MVSNLMLKIVSVILAVGLWFYVYTSDYTEMSFNVPLKVVNLNENLAAINETGLINVVLRGPNFSLKSISFNDIKINIDGSNFEVGEVKYRIKLTEIKVPAGITVVRVEPSEVHFIIDKLITKRVKVNPTFIGEPLKGYKIASVRINPESVQLQGSEKQLSSLDYVDTLPINLSSRYEPLVYSVGLKIPEGSKVVGNNQVEVIVKFTEDIVEYTVNDLELRFKGKKEYLKYELIDKDVIVRLKGRSDKLNLNNIKNVIELFLDVSNIDKGGTYLLKVERVLKSDIEIMEIKPEKVRVKISE
jgi:YbbR domain-containing protein